MSELVANVRTLEWETESFHTLRGTARPFLKWAGGKRSLVPELAQYVGRPGPEGTYYEPFLGSGALFFALNPGRAILSDINWPLIQTFKAVKNKVTALIAYLEAMPKHPTHDQYYLSRRRYNELISREANLSSEELIELSALLIWLNHTCFNGLYRVNGSGRFNVPMGTRVERHIFSAENLKAASMSLRRANAELYSESYEKILSHAKLGDVVYFDPPYEPTNETGAFTEYSAGGFTTEDQVKLANFARSLSEKGCKVVVSNSSAVVVRELYTGFEVHNIMANRMISRNPDDRGPTKELVLVSRK